MPDFTIQDIFRASYHSLCGESPYLSDLQGKTAYDIIRCKSEKCGCNISICTECGNAETHYNSCRNRHCPICQAVNQEIWVDKCRAEFIDSPYFHVVFTLPHELNPLLFCSQSRLYGLLHKCCAQTLLELSSNPRYLSAVLRDKFRENILPCRLPCIGKNGLLFPLPAKPSAIPMNGRISRTAISNSRIFSVTDTEVSFTARGKKPDDPKRTVALPKAEFIRRYLMHVLPRGFQKVRCYGFLNNRMKSSNLKLIFKLQGHQRFRRRYVGMLMA